MKALDLYVASVVLAMGDPNRWEGVEGGEQNFYAAAFDVAHELARQACEYRHDLEAVVDVSGRTPRAWWRCQRCGLSEGSGGLILEEGEDFGLEPLESHIARAKAALSKP